MATHPLPQIIRHLHATVDAQSDAQLLTQFVTARDEAAFAALVRRHGPMVLGVSRRILHHVQDAEDVFQATFLPTIRKRRRFMALIVARRGWEIERDVAARCAEPVAL
jgi:hypothetical protein